MKIERLSRARVFSSDLNFGVLLYSELDGSIVMDRTRIPACSERKHLKFYPPDCCVFTSTGTSGLSIWDANHSTTIYSYKNEHLNDHAYSQWCILASSDELNLKFYDLRSRYMINSKTAKDTVKIAWAGHQIYALGHGELVVSDFRNLSETAFKLSNVYDFAVCNEMVYYLSREKGKSVLHGCTFGVDGKSERLSKTVGYDNLRSTLGGQALGSVISNGIRIERFDKYENIDLGEIQPVQFHLSRDRSYVFSSDAVYLIDGDIGSFVD